MAHMPPTFPPSHGLRPQLTEEGQLRQADSDDMTRKVLILVQLLRVKMRINYHG